MRLTRQYLQEIKYKVCGTIVSLRNRCYHYYYYYYYYYYTGHKRLWERVLYILNWSSVLLYRLSLYTRQCWYQAFVWGIHYVIKWHEDDSAVWDICDRIYVSTRRTHTDILTYWGYISDVVWLTTVEIYVLVCNSSCLPVGVVIWMMS